MDVKHFSMLSVTIIPICSICVPSQADKVLHKRMIKLTAYLPFLTFFFRRSGCLGQLTHTSTNLFPGPVKGRPFTPVLRNTKKYFFVI